MLQPRFAPLGTLSALTATAARAPRLVGLVFAASLACANDGVSAQDAESGASAGTDGSSDASESDSLSAGESDASTSSDTVTGQEEETTGTTTTTGGEDEPALGISIVNIEANQGSAEDIALGSDWVDAGGREIRLLAGRDALIRVNVEVESGWTQHPVLGRLTLTLEGGETRSYEQIVDIAGDSQESFLNTSFYFGLQSDLGETSSQTQFFFELLEVDDGGAGLAQGVTSSPAAGAQLVGFESQPMVMKVLYVPITYNGQEVPVDTPEGQQRLSVIDDELFQTKPVTAIESDVRDAVTYPGTVSSLGNFLPFLSQLRSQDNAPPDLYYVGVVRYASDIAGIANYNARYNANHWPSQGDSGLARTIVHETGHNQNMPHVDCPGANYPAGQEPPGGYPYQDGVINRTGFGLKSLQLHRSDATYDYMGYCGPSWVSTHSWQVTWDILTQDNQSGDDAPPVAEVLNHVVDGQGQHSWWVSTERFDPETLSGNVEVEWTLDDGRKLRTLGSPARMSEVTDLAWTWLPLPKGVDIAQLSDVSETAFERRSDAKLKCVGDERITCTVQDER